MGLVKSKGPVVLIVEDEFLLRMDAVDMIAAAGFEAVEAANARPSHQNSRSPQGHHRGFHRYPDARVDGRIEARPGGQGALAPDQDCRDLRPCRDCGNGFAGRWKVSTEALQSNRGCRRAARSDGGGWIMTRSFRAFDAIRNDESYAIISGVIWSSMKAMRSRS